MTTTISPARLAWLEAIKDKARELRREERLLWRDFSDARVEHVQRLCKELDTLLNPQPELPL